MAPEIFENKDYTIKADVYSFAVNFETEKVPPQLKILDCVVWDNNERDTISGYKESSCDHEICYSSKGKTRSIKNSTKLPQTSK